MARAYFVIGIQLDPVPGHFHHAEDWEAQLLATLPDWYHPTVTQVEKQPGHYPAQYVQVSGSVGKAGKVTDGNDLSEQEMLAEDFKPWPEPR